MTQFVFSNNASTTVAAAITGSSTTLPVASGAAFPVPIAGQQFAIWMTDAATKLVHEVMYVTANANNQFTVVRGQEGTTATSWAIGDYVQHVWTAGTAVGALGSGYVAHSSISANYTIQQSDNQTIIEATGTINITFPQGLITGTSVTIFQNAGTEIVSIQSPGSFYGNGVFTTSSLVLLPSFAYTFTYDGLNWIISQAAQPGRLLNVQTFTANGTYTETVGTNNVVVDLVGGGGAGGGAQANATAAGAGGQGGAYGRGRYTVAQASGAAVVIGAGGAGTAGASGSAGGTSSFGSLMSAPGGAGGPASALTLTALLSPSGSSTGGNILNQAGCMPMPGMVLNGAAAVGGNGGAGPWGGGGLGAQNLSSANGGSASANGFGGGGGGANNYNTTTAYAGGAGASGIAIVWEYS